LKIADFAKRNQIPLEVAVDVGCGSGQSTLPLGSYCQRVIGTDISHEQIKQAVINNTSHDNVTYKVASADKLPFGDEEVSMVTCGQAWHWFDPPTVHSEVNRILKSPGCLAIFGSGKDVIDIEKCHKYYMKFCEESIYKYRHPSSTPLDSLYDDIVTPFPQSERHQWSVKINKDISQFIGRISTSSAWQRFIQSNPTSNLLKDLEENLQLETDTLPITYTVFLLLYLKQ
jgi:ubiquinone/menaquinone biosynthesis C-methylase UbiE